MTSGFLYAYRRFLIRWTEIVRRWALVVVLLSLSLAVGTGVYVAKNFAVNTDTLDMLSTELPWRRWWQEAHEAFPQFHDTLVVLVEGQTADLADDAAMALSVRLRDRPEVFGDVFYPQGDVFFRRNGLLYLDVDALYELSDKLAAAQPFLGALSSDPSLRGLLEMLGLAIDEVAKASDVSAFDLAPILNAIAEVVEAQKAGRFAQLSWQRVMTGEAEPADEKAVRLIVVQPVLDYASMQPAAAAMDAIRALVNELNLDQAHGVTVRLTGEAALETEELASVESGMGLAGALSLTLVSVLLAVCFASMRLISVTLITLVVGLIWTFAFALAAVGTLNLISVAFAVLFIGLGIDFGIHYSLRYREALGDGAAHAGALRQTARDVGGALTLCAIAAAISFYSFLPTDYVGLAELGVISGTGMLIALFANITLLPALLTLTPPHPPRPSGIIRTFATRFSQTIQSHARPIVWSALVLAIVSALLLPQARFDIDPDKLKDPDSESVSALNDLRQFEAGATSSLNVLSEDLASAEALARRASELDLVGGVRTLADFLPADQEEKLEIIGTLALVLEPAFTRAPKPPPSVADMADALDGLERNLLDLAMVRDEATAAAAQRLLSTLVDWPEKGRDEAALQELQFRLLAGFPGRMTALRQSLRATSFDLEGLPAEIRARWITDGGLARVEIYPKERIEQDDGALHRFVDEVRTVAPEAIGEPVVLVETKGTVIWAFIEAATIAVVAIAVLLGVLIRNVRDVALIFAPLILAALLTVAVTVVIDLPFNLANIIALPLLFGLGVAGSLQLVLRERTVGGSAVALSSSTPRAVLFSAMTTIGSFGTLALSNHLGIANMGLLLAIAITLSLLCTLVVTPALMAVYGRTGPGAGR